VHIKGERRKRTMKSKIISIALLATLLLGMAAAIPIRADIADIEFYVDPAINSFDYPAKPVNSTFDVIVWFKDELPLAAVFSWQVTLLYNATQLQCINATQAAGDSQYLFYGKSTVKPDPSYDFIPPDTGSVQLMDSLYSGNASGLLKKLGTFTFKILIAPAKLSTLSSSLNIDNDATFWGTEDLTYYDPIRTDGTYELEWTAPPNPHLEVTPPASGLIFGPGPCVDQLFDVDVTLKAIDEAWSLHNVSFTLTYNDTILTISNYVVGPFWITPTVVNATAGIIDVFVVAPSAPSGDKLLITITFRIIHQNTSPEPDETSPLALSDIVIWDTSLLIPTDDPVDSLVTIRAFIPFTPPHFEVSSPTLGPGPVPAGTMFDVNVTAKGLNALAYFIGYDFRLSYDESIITPVTANEGPFLPYYAALQPGSLGTWWAYWFEPDGYYGPNVLVGNIIYPNETGKWWYPFPEGDGVVATITFSCDVEQSYGEADFASYLNIIEEDWVGIDNPAGAQNIVDVPHLDPVNGTFSLTTNWPGRMIDVYTQYPAPFGGQGLRMPSDMFWPQKQVELYANVTYNYWPVQEKDVAFEVRDPHGTLVTIQVARTDLNGVAHTWYRIPWPCDDPEELFGVWNVTATVDIACIVVNDTMQFHFDYMVEIFKVTTDKFQVNHYPVECFNVIIEYGSHAQQEYPVVLQAILYDNLDVPVIQGFIQTTVGGTVFCEYKNNTVIIPLCIPKYAFAGIAHIYVNAYDAIPTQGGSAWCPTFGLMNPFGYSWPIGSSVPIIAIQPH
jgi:hypothetical protein